MLREARNRGSVPECICFDSWYASLENLKAVRSYGWKWVTRLAANRLVSKDYSGKGFRVFKVDTPEGDIEYRATNDLHMDELVRLKYTEGISIAVAIRSLDGLGQ